MSDLDEIFDEHYPVGTVKANDSIDDDKAILMTEVLKHRRNAFKQAILQSYRSLEEIEKAIPEKKEYPASAEEPTFVDIQATGAVTGYNQAIDDIRKALKIGEGDE